MSYRGGCFERDGRPGGPTALANHPDQSAAEIIEQALAERLLRENATLASRPKRTRQEFHAWLDGFTAFSDKIPNMPGETFSRETIYRDHD